MLAHMPKPAQPPAEIAATIRVVRGQRVLLDVDLALVYGVTTKRLNEQVRRNADRFPADFLIRLTKQDLTNLRSQIATSSWGGRRYLPLAFTEHGAIMAATILDSPRAV
ncbi:MAG: ORF6N domain-containing protein [Gammaproteobacteria bacterium]|nr:ORF6N domain-containing protein [Gammaproteobacteria bacterium]